ncbi:MAG TPA: RNA-binding transcriptional accessory protein, partial [Planctomycetaceae bacterium]|nr:RNA-binding transcriptional accessory protein [Planctomycetaceae bacterium]
MAEPVTINLRHIARGLGIPARQVQAVVELLDEGNTVPFITRYRKDQTGGLNEEQIRQIQARLTKARLLAERKQTILRSIESQGKLTPELEKRIRAAGSAKRIEDLYLPYKPKKQTLATAARSHGLEPLAREIVDAAPSCADLDARAADFVNPDRQVPTVADALLGAGHIIAEQLSERADL